MLLAGLADWQYGSRRLGLCDLASSSRAHRAGPGLSKTEIPLYQASQKSAVRRLGPN